MRRLALLGAFPVPAPFGSQRYFAAQATALADAGADVMVLRVEEETTQETLRALATLRALEPQAMTPLEALTLLDTLQRKLGGAT